MKAALFVLEHDLPVLPVLACSWSGPTAWWMAYDVGYFTTQLHVQVFSPRINETDFEDVKEDTGLLIARHDGPVSNVTHWLANELRKEPPNQAGSGAEWWRVQVERFQHLAPHVVDFRALGGTLSTDSRRETFAAWRSRVSDVAPWPLRRGW